MTRESLCLYFCQGLSDVELETLRVNLVTAKMWRDQLDNMTKHWNETNRELGLEAMK